jgi:hypothetical protein
MVKSAAGRVKVQGGAVPLALALGAALLGVF